MKNQVTKKKLDNEPKREYSVQFECMSHFLAHFEDSADLTDEAIIQRGLQIAASMFGDGGTLLVEKMTNHGSYTFSAEGVNRASAQILGRPRESKPQLKLVKTSTAQR